MEYSDFDPREDYHMGSDNWVDILRAWRDFYETESYEALCDRLFKWKEESFREYPKYRRFIYRMEYMMKVGKEKGFDLICIMGP